MKKKWTMITISVLLAAAAVIGVRQILAEGNEQSITKQDAAATIQEHYSGDVKKLITEGNVFQIEFQNALGMYQLIMDRETGNIIELTRIKTFQNKANESQTTPPQPKISEQKAKQIASNDTNGRVEGIQLDVEDGQPVYRIDVRLKNQKATLVIDGNTGETLSYAKHPKPNEPGETKVSVEEAKHIATSKVEGEVEDVELEERDGAHVYKVEIESGDQDVDVFIQAYTGDILYVTYEDDDVEDDD